MGELSGKKNKLMSLIEKLGNVSQISELKGRLAELTAMATFPDKKLGYKFWNEYGMLQKKAEQHNILLKEADELLELSNIVEECGEIQDINSCIKSADELIDKMFNYLMINKLNGEYDINDAIMTIKFLGCDSDRNEIIELFKNAYQNFLKRKEYSINPVEESDGISSFIVSGDYAHGFLKGEQGIHKLIRTIKQISGESSKEKLVSSKINIIVEPKIDNQENVLKEEDIREDRMGGRTAGGSNANTANNCVRLTHLPTGIISVSATHRYLIANQKKAYEVLKSRVQLFYENRDEFERRKLLNNSPNINAIVRTYRISGGNWIIDQVTGVKSNNPKAFFNGEIDEFIKARFK